MSSFRFLTASLLGSSLLLLLTAVCEAQYDDNTTPPDYYDLSTTFEYSFYSNTSDEELEKFSEQFIDTEEDELEGNEVTGDQKVVTVAQSTQRTKVNVHSSSPLPISWELRTLFWTLMILMVLNIQQL